MGLLQMIPGQARQGYDIESLSIFKNAIDFDKIFMKGYFLDDKYLVGLLAMVDVDWVFAV